MKQTHVAIKIVNNTSHAFKYARSNLPLSQEERDSITLPPMERTTFRYEPDYNYGYPWPNNKNLFNTFIEFSDEGVGFRLELALTMTRSFGVLTPTIKPNIKNIVRSIGQAPLRCSTKTINISNEAPFNFEVEIMLG
jgi:hypothetical protein